MNQAIDTQMPNGQHLDCDVFSYKDYRIFLRDWMTTKKRRNPKFSGAAFARKAQISSSTFLGMVTKGKRNLSAKTIRAFIRGLELTGNAATYFENLVYFNQSKTIHDQNVYLARLTQLTTKRPISEELQVLRDHADYVGAWYHPIVREFCALMPEKTRREETSPALWISRRMSNSITLRQAELSIELLIRMGLIAVQSNGTFELREQKILLEPEKSDRGVQLFHKCYLEQAAKFSLIKNRNERSYQFVTLSTNAAEHMVLQEKIYQFWKGLINEHPLTDAPPDRVVAISLQSILLGKLEDEQTKGKI